MENRFQNWSDATLKYELDFLFYECGRIGRGHAEQAKQAKEEALEEMEKRGFEDFTALSKHVRAIEKEQDIEHNEFDMPLLFEGQYFTVHTKNISNQMEFQLAEKVIALAEENDSKPCDVKSFCETIQGILPEGYKSGGGAHHIWIHPKQSEALNVDFGIWFMHDVFKYERMRKQEDARILAERTKEDLKAYSEAKKAA